VDLQRDPVLRAQVERLQSLGGVNSNLESNVATAPLGMPVAQQDVATLRSMWHSAAVFFGIIVLLDLCFVLLSRPRIRMFGGLFLLAGTFAAIGVMGCGEAKHTAPAATSPAGAQSEAKTADFAMHGPNETPAPMFAEEGAPQIPNADISSVQPTDHLDDLQVLMLNDETPNAAQSSLEALQGNAEASSEELITSMTGPRGIRMYRDVNAFRFVPHDLDRFRRGQMQQAEIGSRNFVVREYSYRQRQKRGDVRDDFTETLYWNPLLIADEQGRASIEFDLSDSITTFRITAHTHDNAGGLGTGRGEVMSRRPFYLEPKLPLEVTVGDRIDLPVAVVNGTSNAIDASLDVTLDAVFTLKESGKRSLKLDADSRRRELFPFVVSRFGSGKVSVTGTAGQHRDAVKRTLNSVPQGFPINESKSGVFSPGESQISFILPEKWQSDSLRVQLKAFPSPVADALQGLAGMLQEPSGCFEQTTSSNYPNTMVLRLLSGSQDKTPADTKLAAIRRAKDLLGRGYARLKGYESKSGGFEWFGGDPGHEALTAFGLMQFYDMAPVFPVDQAMLNRTTQWLMSRRNGSGTFNINPRYLHSWGAPHEVVSAYILWALTETKQSPILLQLSNELAWAERVTGSSKDPYLLALCAASLGNAERFEAADAILGRLSELAQPDGSFDGSTTVTVSGGDAKQIETTALVAIAYQKRPAYAAKSQKLIEWLRSRRSGGGHFSSTQATVLALKAMLGASAPVTPNGSQTPVIIIQQDGTEVARLNLVESQTPQLDLPTTILKPGENSLTVLNGSGVPVAYAFDIRFYSDKPASDDRSPLRLSTALSSNTVEAGQVVTLSATLKNTSESGQPMTVVSLGLPAGVEARTAQLDELKDKGVIDYYELSPRTIVCYWRTLEAKQQIDLKLDLTAEIPGHFTGPASRTWLYYTAEQKQWADGLVVDIDSK
jgi:uncharacterized protein YfaS (alpha-2-macroglobulin family)